ncbi:hypothetical protein [Oscillibacter sp. CU971]|uniref:hypothetical protein n=1 Tax=Oscillibacter sp. CU971 TaxID=2780102 RepID=UPI0019593432|nr:hypothetical protein [Oscillibacter sp. CU971]
MPIILRLFPGFCKVNSSQKDSPDFAAPSGPDFQTGGLLSLFGGHFKIPGNFPLNRVSRWRTAVFVILLNGPLPGKIFASNFSVPVAL